MAMRITPQHDVTTVVIVGKFAPAMFHPLWFAERKLIGKQEAEEAEVALLHAEITQFKTGRLDFDIQEARFAVSSSLVPEATRDLLLDLFGVQLPGVPVHAVGINRTVHFDAGSQGRQQHVGVSLAPHKPWGTWAKEMTDSEPRVRNGLSSLRMLVNRKKDEPLGYVGVRLEPSSRLTATGIFMEINNHYSSAVVREVQDASLAMAILGDQWEVANTCAEEIIDQIMALAQSVPK